MHSKQYLVALLLFVAGCTQAFASSPMLTKALDLYNVSEFEESLKIFRLAASKDKEAFYFIGRMFALGEGVDVDLDSAAWYYRKGIAAGDPKNNYGLFFFHYHGLGGYEQDEVKAASVLEACYADITASAKASAFWKSILAVMYYWGYYVPQNFDTAFYFYSAAARQEWSMAQYNLGVMYERGEGVTRDQTQAIHWYTQSAANGFSNATYNLGLLYELGEHVPQDEKKAFALYQKAALKRHVGAQIRLAGLYKYGAGTEPDLEKAEYWYQQASASGDADADSQLTALKGSKKLKYFRLLRWQKALEQARKENKLVFVDFYTTWCGPCRWMENNVFTAPEVEQFMSDRFICLRINIEQEEEALVEKMQVESIPTLVFFDPNGNVLHRESGALPSEDLISLAQRVLDSRRSTDHGPR